MTPLQNEIMGWMQIGMIAILLAVVLALMVIAVFLAAKALRK